MSGYVTFTTSKKKAKRRDGYQYVKGIGLIGFDQNMDNHHVLSDRAAYAADKKALKKDLTKVWTGMVKREFDAA